MTSPPSTRILLVIFALFTFILSPTLASPVENHNPLVFVRDHLSRYTINNQQHFLGLTAPSQSISGGFAGQSTPTAAEAIGTPQTLSTDISTARIGSPYNISIPLCQEFFRNGNENLWRTICGPLTLVTTRCNMYASDAPFGLPNCRDMEQYRNWPVKCTWMTLRNILCVAYSGTNRLQPPPLKSMLLMPHAASIFLVWGCVSATAPEMPLQVDDSRAVKGNDNSLQPGSPAAPAADKCQSPRNAPSAAVISFAFEMKYLAAGRRNARFKSVLLTFVLASVFLFSGSVAATAPFASPNITGVATNFRDIVITKLHLEASMVATKDKNLENVLITWLPFLAKLQSTIQPPLPHNLCDTLCNVSGDLATKEGLLVMTVDFSYASMFWRQLTCPWGWIHIVWGSSVGIMTAPYIYTRWGLSGYLGKHVRRITAIAETDEFDRKRYDDACTEVRRQLFLLAMKESDLGSKRSDEDKEEYSWLWDVQKSITLSALDGAHYLALHSPIKAPIVPWKALAIVGWIGLLIWCIKPVGAASVFSEAATSCGTTGPTTESDGLHGMGYGTEGSLLSIDSSISAPEIITKTYTVVRVSKTEPASAVSMPTSLLASASVPMPMISPPDSVTEKSDLFASFVVEEHKALAMSYGNPTTLNTSCGPVSINIALEQLRAAVKQHGHTVDPLGEAVEQLVEALKRSAQTLERQLGEQENFNEGNLGSVLEGPDTQNRDFVDIKEDISRTPQNKTEGQPEHQRETSALIWTIGFTCYVVGIWHRSTYDLRLRPEAPSVLKKFCMGVRWAGLLYNVITLPRLAYSTATFVCDGLVTVAGWIGMGRFFDGDLSFLTGLGYSGSSMDV